MPTDNCLLSNLSVVQVMADPLEHLQSHAVEFVLPIFRQASQEVESLLLEMHEADWSQETPVRGADTVLQTSRYIKRLEAFFKRFRHDYLNKFVPQPSPNLSSFATMLCRRLAARTLAVFVRLAALLRPLGEQGKLQLAKVRFESTIALCMYSPAFLLFCLLLACLLSFDRHRRSVLPYVPFGLDVFPLPTSEADVRMRMQCRTQQS